jgi:uncharacterized protein YbaP (TraB family)
MKKVLLLVSYITSLVSSAFFAQAQDSNSLLWKISGKNLAKPSYLFGTIHLICRNDFLWTTAMDTSLLNSDKVCFEMALDDPNLAVETAKGMMNTNGKKLKDYFTEEQYAILKKYVHDTMNMDISAFEQMKPAALQMMLGSSDVGCEDQVSYEDSMMVIAKKLHKGVLGLESLQEQIAVLETIPVTDVVKDIMDFIQHPKSSDGEYRQIVTAYRQQDLAALFTLINNVKEAGADMRVFLDERNKKWIPRIESMMKGTSVFFAVGAGHLSGQQGVVSLLKQKGYTVEPVK